MVNTLFNDIKWFPVFSRKENDHHLNLYLQTQDRSHLNTLLKGNLRFIASVASNYNYKHIDREDLVNEGCLGFLQAIRHYDPKLGVERKQTFLTYAVWWIRQAITKAIWEANLVQVPRNVACQRKRILSLLEQQEGELDFHMVVEALGKGTGVKVADAQFIYNAARSDWATYTDVYEDTTVADYGVEPSVDNAIMQLEPLLNHVLDKRAADIIRLRFGLEHGVPVGLHDIGRAFKLSKERVRQIIKRSLADLKAQVMRRGLRK